MSLPTTLQSTDASGFTKTDHEQHHDTLHAFYNTSNVTDLVALGGAGDGSTDDTTAVQAAEASTKVVFSPSGTFLTTIAGASLTGRFRGVGQVKDSGGNKRAPWFSQLTAAPSSLGSWDSPVTAFNGDLSKVQIAMEHRVTGSSTLGTPATGYEQDPEASPFVGYLYNTSGHNEDTASNDGRTGVSLLNLKVFQAGQGDAGAVFSSTFVTGSLSGATTFLSNPAGVLLNGQVDAGSDGVYLNPLEFNLNGHSYDVAGIGLVLNLDRNSETGNLDVCWGGVRVQNTGSKAADVGFMAVNAGAGDGFQVGLDLANADLPTSGTWINAAITMKQDQRIYLDATGADAGASLYRRPSSTGTTWMTYNSSLPAIHFVVSNTTAMQIGSSNVVFPNNVIFADAKNIVVNTSTGTKIGTGTTQKLGFWNNTPIAQPSSTGETTGFTAGGGTAVTDSSTFTGNVGSTAYRISDVVKHLKNIGLIAA